MNMSDALMIICLNHRSRFGIREEPKASDCEVKSCRTGCPIYKMPKAITPKEMINIAKEVKKEDRLEKLKAAELEA